MVEVDGGAGDRGDGGEGDEDGGEGLHGVVWLVWKLDWFGSKVRSRREKSTRNVWRKIVCWENEMEVLIGVMMIS